MIFDIVDDCPDCFGIIKFIFCLNLLNVGIERQPQTARKGANVRFALIRAGKADSPAWKAGLSARMTWCAPLARGKSFECRSIPTVRADFGAHR
jgi:hypothetical protein